MPEEGRYRFEAHATVDRLGGEGVPQLVGVDVPDAGGGRGLADGVVDAGAGDRPGAVGEQPVSYTHLTLPTILLV